MNKITYREHSLLEGAVLAVSAVAALVWLVSMVVTIVVWASAT
ncbi:hypothetical protein [Streptomyces sp. 8N706]